MKIEVVRLESDAFSLRATFADVLVMGHGHPDRTTDVGTRVLRIVQHRVDRRTMVRLSGRELEVRCLKRPERTIFASKQTLQSVMDSLANKALELKFGQLSVYGGDSSRRLRTIEDVRGAREEGCLVKVDQKLRLSLPVTDRDVARISTLPYLYASLDARDPYALHMNLALLAEYADDDPWQLMNGFKSKIKGLVV